MKLKDRRAMDVAILEMSAAGLPQPKIQQHLGVTPQAIRDVKKAYEKVFKNISRVESYRKIKGDILAAAQLTALESAMSPEKLAKASFVSTLSGFEILNKAERLNDDKSTENIEHQIFGKIALVDQTND